MDIPFRVSLSNLNLQFQRTILKLQFAKRRLPNFEWTFTFRIFTSVHAKIHIYISIRIYFFYFIYSLKKKKLYQIIYFILHFIKILFLYLFFTIISNHLSLSFSFNSQTKTCKELLKFTLQSYDNFSTNVFFHINIQIDVGDFEGGLG